MKPSITILRAAFTIAIIDEGFKGAKFERVKSSVVNAKSYIHPYDALQTAHKKAMQSYSFFG